MEISDANRLLEELPRRIDASLEGIKKAARALDAALEELRKAEERLKTYK